MEIARSIVDSCVTKYGISTGRDEYWTGFALFIAGPVVNTSDILNHLTQLALRQTDEGMIPAMYIHPRKVVEPPISHSPDNSELLYIIGVSEHGADRTFHTPFITRAIHLWESRGSMIVGSDWRGILELKTNIVLGNSVLHYKTMSIVHPERCGEIKKFINYLLWDEDKGYYRDHTGTDQFDLVGNAMAILYDIADEQKAGRIVGYTLVNLSTPRGFRSPKYIECNDAYSEMIAGDEMVIPWCSLYMLIAIAKYDKPSARQRLSAWFHDYSFQEWYSVSGIPGGKLECPATAAMYLRAKLAVDN